MVDAGVAWIRTLPNISLDICPHDLTQTHLTQTHLTQTHLKQTDLTQTHLTQTPRSGRATPMARDGTLLPPERLLPSMTAPGTVLDRIRRPEYTGENRCIPCTATNLVITAIVAVVLSVVWPPLGVAFAVLGLASIWLRGYLVPGTPELTKRYFPEWLLARFDKLPDSPPEPIDPDEFDPEAILSEAGVVEPCVEEDDLCLTEAFAETWREGMASFGEEEALRDGLADQLELDADGVSFETYGDAFIARDDGVRIGQWESRAALLADLAAARELPERIPNWEALTPRQRSQLLGGLRVFVEDCPVCGGPVAADTEVVESCCRSTTVVGVGCDDCGQRLLEVPYDESAVEDAAA